MSWNNVIPAHLLDVPLKQDKPVPEAKEVAEDKEGRKDAERNQAVC